MQFHVTAAREFVYEQRDSFINVVLSARSQTSDGETEQPFLHIRAWAALELPSKNMSALLFREQRPDEDEKTAADLIEHGISDLSVSIQAIASDRTVVEVRCLTEAMAPAAMALLKQFAQLYLEAKPEIEALLFKQNSDNKKKELSSTERQEYNYCEKAIKAKREHSTSQEDFVRLQYSHKGQITARTLQRWLDKYGLSWE